MTNFSGNKIGSSINNNAILITESQIRKWLIQAGQELQAFAKYQKFQPRFATLSRLEKAIRVNEVEESKNRTRSALTQMSYIAINQQLTRQSTELTNELKFIRSHSGYLETSLPASEVESARESQRHRGVTYFMYGQRLYSRQFGKFRSKSGVDTYASTRQLLLGVSGEKTAGGDEIISHSNPFWRLYYGAGGNAAYAPTAVESIRRIVSQQLRRSKLRTASFLEGYDSDAVDDARMCQTADGISLRKTKSSVSQRPYTSNR